LDSRITLVTSSPEKIDKFCFLEENGLREEHFYTRISEEKTKTQTKTKQNKTRLKGGN